MSFVERIPVSVVVSTFNRPAACRAAVESALAQRPAPLEVLVCDDGSPTSVAAALQEWSDEVDGVEYLGVTPNRGTPAPARNAGVRAARGDWVGFLDDDDRWLPGKLASQWAHAASGRWDVISGGATRLDGCNYFTPETRPPREPDASDLDVANPVILSTALVRRSLLLLSGGFPERGRYAGIEDYSLWLTLADQRARFLVLEEPLALYDDSGTERLSSAAVRLQLAMAEVSARRWLREPWRRSRANAAIRECRLAARLVLAGLRPT
jgi:glycosyltransferase involved in cell wall biosynthesis